MTLVAMQIRRFILQSVLYYRWSYLGVLLGAVLGAMVLLGALFAGDSVTASLKRISAMRTGQPGQATHLMTAMRGIDSFARPIWPI